MRCSGSDRGRGASTGALVILGIENAAPVEPWVRPYELLRHPLLIERRLSLVVCTRAHTRETLLTKKEKRRAAGCTWREGAAPKPVIRPWAFHRGGGAHTHCSQ